MAKCLVRHPDAEQFMTMAVLESGARALLGDPERADVDVRPYLLSACIELRHAAGKVAALVDDPTRSEVDKHIAAKRITDKLVGKLSETHAALVERAERLLSESLEAADRDFAPRASRAGLESELRSWLREHGRTPEGLGAIKGAVAEYEDLAAVVWHSPRFLLGVGKETHESLRAHALRAHRPKLAARLDAGEAVSVLVDKFEKVIRGAPLALYNAEMAKQSERRVEE